MANIKALEDAIKEWQAKEVEFKKKGDSVGQNTTGIVVASLKLALNYINQTSNTQIHMDTNPCDNCEAEKKNYPWPPFCKWCGRALSQ